MSSPILIMFQAVMSIWAFVCSTCTADHEALPAAGLLCPLLSTQVLNQESAASAPAHELLQGKPANQMRDR